MAKPEKKSFNDKKGAEYDLIERTDPYFRIMQLKLGEIVKSKFKYSGADNIDILEIGCGTGYTTKILLNQDERFKVVGVDNERKMLNQAKYNLKSFIASKRLKLIQKDALNFLKSCPSNLFDCFVSAFTLHNFNQKYRNKVLLEIYRVLRKGGFFINLDKYSLDNPMMRKKALSYQLSQFEKTLPLNLSNVWIKHYLHDEKRDFLMKEKESINIMKKIGFVQAKILTRRYMKAILFVKKR